MRETKKKQRKHYSGKKKRHTIKTQIVVDKSKNTVICTSFSNGKKHDFRLFKESKTHINPSVKVLADTGYQGIQKIHKNSVLPKKRKRNVELTREEKLKNQEIARDRVANENVIGFLKRFKIISDKYRNRRKRFGLRFNLIAGICNLEF